ncbi:hypothetical protein [Candidatus Tisiphia endosymbiont of Hybos culiciformis]|uniref:hypothetical protein n=1 Tax=Candidatus Tisiphia endosymbiont of Hybos culiciformis TaxID=3139331 RepID=UPI003CCB1368
MAENRQISTPNYSEELQQIHSIQVSGGGAVTFLGRGISLRNDTQAIIDVSINLLNAENISELTELGLAVSIIGAESIDNNSGE